MPEKISPGPEREKITLSEIVEEFKYKIADFVPRNKMATALLIVAALGTGCARMREQRQEPSGAQEIERLAPEIDEGNIVKEIKPTDSETIESLRRQISEEPTEEVEQETDITTDISEEEVIKACEEVMSGDHKVGGINILSEKKILSALVEVPNEGAAETEEQTTYRALIFKIDDNNNLRLISKFATDAFDVPKYQMEHNEAIASSGLTLEELKWLVWNSSEDENLISVK